MKSKFIFIRIILLYVLLELLLPFTLQAQSRKISLQVDNQTVAQVMKMIEQKSGFTFIYKDDVVDISRKVSIHATNEDVLDVLKKVFAGTTTEATIVNHSINLTRKNVTPTSNTTPSSAQGPTHKLSGTVLDSQGQPIVGATVLVDGTSNGVGVDLDGNYTLSKVPEGAKIRFSCLGYVDQVKPFKGEKTINAILYEDSESLEEAVAVAFGTQTKESIVGAVTSLNPSRLRAPTSNLTTALAGNIAGIISYQRSGEPGADDASFFIRGITTFGANTNPLILIDNVELTTTDLARLQPDDIESFSIMKDATATALYGSRAANGVILVKTKEGRKSKAKVNVRYEHSFSQPTQEIKLETDPQIYMRLHNEAIKSRDPSSPLLYSEYKIRNTSASNPTYEYPYTNWHDTMLKKFAQNDRANLNVSGGGDIVRYYVSASVDHDTGILNVKDNAFYNYNSNIDLTTYTLRSNININLSKTTEMILRMSGVIDDYSGPINGGTGTYNQIMAANPVLFPATFPSELSPYTEHVLYGNYGAGNYINPYAEMTRGYKEYGRVNLSMQFELKQKLDFITKGLAARAMLNTSHISYYENTRYINPYYYYYAGINPLTKKPSLECINPLTGTEYLNYNNGGKWMTSDTYFAAALNYAREFNMHSVSGMLVFQLQDQRQPNATNLQDSLPYRNVGISGRFTYDYGKRYFAEFNFGYNGSERFSKKKRFGFFPSVGAAWLISNEPFFAKLKDYITTLKLRASYGLVGNDNIGATRFLYLSQVNLSDGNLGTQFGTLANGEYLNGISIARYANPDIGWEVARKTNIALEFVWKERLHLTTEYYWETRDNILQTRSYVPASMGLSSVPQANIGKASGHGLDIELDYSRTFSNQAWLQVRGNLTFAKSKYIVVEEDNYPNAPWRSKVGHSLGQAWGYIGEYLFIDDAEVENSPTQFGEYMAGDIKYRDINKDGVINGEDMVPIGYPVNPELIYGFGASFGIKGFDLSVFFQGLGRESFWINYNTVSPFFNTASGMIGNNQLAKFIADDHWSESNRDPYATWPRLSSSAVANNDVTSTWFMPNGSFLRLKQLEFGYTLPKKVTDKMRMDSLRIYLSGTNLLCFSNFKLWDPEMAGNGLGYPVQRVVNLGVNVNF